jgi:hypothetical protein
VLQAIATRLRFGTGSADVMVGDGIGRWPFEGSAGEDPEVDPEIWRTNGREESNQYVGNELEEFYPPISTLLGKRIPIYNF